MSPEDFARRMYDELERGEWGDIDPFLFKCVADGESGDSDVRGLREVIARALGDDS